MKKILLTSILALLSGCYEKDDGTDFFTNIRKIEGHKYISYSNGRGCCIIHAESCECKKQGKSKVVEESK